MRAKKDILSVIAGRICRDIHPFHNELQINYKDGTTANIDVKSSSVLKHYGDYLSENDKLKFAEFAEQKFFGKSQKAYDKGVEVNYDGMLRDGHDFSM